MLPAERHFDILSYDDLCLLDMLGKSYLDKDSSTFPYESEVYKTLIEEWADQARQALDKALAILGVSSLPADNELLYQVLTEFEQKLSRNFGAAVEADIRSLFDMSYHKGKYDILLPKEIALEFTVIDEAAITWLQNHHLYWIDHYYTDQLSSQIAKVIEEGMQQGLGRVDIGNDLKKFFKDYPGIASKPDVYFRGLAANGMNRSRSFGMIQGYVDAHVIELEIMAVMDERTSEICREMNGRRIPVSVAVQQRDELMMAASPEDVKTIAPWPKLDDIKGLQTGDILAQGVRMPPFHYF